MIGKFSPDYRNSRDQERGIWTEEFSTEYEIVEKIGGGASYQLETEDFGVHSLAIALFANDTSWLADSVLARRDDVCESNQGFGSWSVLLEGQLPRGAHTAYYQFGRRRIKACELEARDEEGMVATIGNVFGFSPSDHVQSDVLAEIGLVEDFEGSNDFHQNYSLSSVTTINGRWNVSIGGTVRLVGAGGARDYRDHLFQLTAGYAFRNRLKIDGGWLYLDQEGVRDSVFGLLIRYESIF